MSRRERNLAITLLALVLASGAGVLWSNPRHRAFYFGRRAGPAPASGLGDSAGAPAVSPVAALIPGLLLVGAGMGLVLAPLAGTILQTLDPRHAGAASGMLNTMQNVGNALGVAVSGVIFFGTVGGGYAHAFELVAAELALLLIVVAALTRLLPRLT